MLYASFFCDYRLEKSSLQALIQTLKFLAFDKILLRLRWWKLQFQIFFPILPTYSQKYSFDFSQSKAYKYFSLIKEFHKMIVRHCPNFATTTIAPNAWCRESNSMYNMTSVPRLTIDEFKKYILLVIQKYLQMNWKENNFWKLTDTASLALRLLSTYRLESHQRQTTQNSIGIFG